MFESEEYDTWMFSWEKNRREMIAKENVERENFIQKSGDASLNEHDCFEGGRIYYKNFDTVALGEHSWWEFTFLICKHCKLKYLRAFLETDGYSHSGRWVLGRILKETAERDINLESALILLANYDQVFYGGSYWGHAGKWSQVHHEMGAFPHESLCT